MSAPVSHVTSCGPSGTACPGVQSVSAYPAQVITSTANPRVKWLATLRKRRVRDAEGVTAVEGYDEVRLAVDAGIVPMVVVHCPDLAGDDIVAEDLGGADTEVLGLGRAAFAKVSYRQSPDGWLAVLPNPQRPLADLPMGEQPLVLVAEALEKPGNLGAMLRTADAAGADAVVAASPITDWGNPNLVRASKGTVFTVPVASAASGAVADWLDAHDIRPVVAAPEAASPYTDVDLTGGIAIVVGAEHEGVTDVWPEAARVRLPMRGRVNSLNVSTSAAVLLYEALRQRSVRVS